MCPGMSDKLQHEMYWNYLALRKALSFVLINYNMRCIETGNNRRDYNIVYDKLQHEMYWNTKPAKNDDAVWR